MCPELSRTLGRGQRILVPRGRAPFGQHQEITTSGLVQHRKSTIHGLPVTLRMLRVKSDKSDWFWFQSIVFTKPFKNRMSLDQARGRDFLVLTKRSAASGDENGVQHICKQKPREGKIPSTLKSDQTCFQTLGKPSSPLQGQGQRMRRRVPRA